MALGPRQVEAPVEGRRQQGRGARSSWTEGGLREGPVPRAPAARVSGPGWVLTGVTSERFVLLNLKQHQPF